MAVWHPGDRLAHDLIVPLTREFREKSGGDRRRAESGFEFSRYQPRSRDHARHLLFVNLDADSAEIYQAFEQLYGVSCRDPMAYRPFVEFCFGLPTDLFMRDGEPRWLAKQLAAGIMPEEQRRNLRNGRWDADWLSRIKLRADDYREQLDRAADDPEIAEMIDIPRLRAALENLPDQTSTDPQVFMPIQFAVVRGLLTARYINHIRGRN
jgi:asparagine synthase (glutamine-hydrolysing)